MHSKSNQKKLIEDEGRIFTRAKAYTVDVPIIKDWNNLPSTAKYLNSERKNNKKVKEV